MAKLKYKVVPKGAAEGRVPINLIFVDKKDVDNLGLSLRDACEIVAKDFKEPSAIDIIDMSAVTVSSDGIMVDCAVVAFASIDNGVINKEVGFMGVTEVVYERQLIEEEPHLLQWNLNYPGRRLYRGPNIADKSPRTRMNENQTITGRIANNNTGSEMMDIIEMTEILTPVYGILEIMRGGDVLIGLAGPEFSVGIGMVVKEHFGRIFDWSYGAGQSAHASGIFAKTVKADYPAIAGTKATLAEYTLRAITAGMVVGRDISSSPANLCLAKATGYPIDLDNITEEAWIELNSVGITKEWLQEPCEKMTVEKAIAHADEIVPGMVGTKRFNALEITEIRYAEF
jgi:hypothetical protein